MKTNTLNWDNATAEQKKELAQIFDSCQIAIKETEEWFKKKNKAKKAKK